MRKLLIAMFSTLLLSNVVVQTASAHVLITDQTKSKGAILHITPDDDPIAGQPATLYFDTQNQLITQGSSVKLVISDENGLSSAIEPRIDGSLATATYIFPTQGVYRLAFTVNSSGQIYTFEQAHRVSRGTASSALDKPTYAWAEVALVACSSLFLLILIVVFNRRKEIAAQSKF